MAQPTAERAPAGAAVPPDGAARDPVFVGVAALAVALLGWCATGLWAPSDRTASLLLVLAAAGLYLWTALLGFQLVGLLGRGHPARRFWRAWSVAGLCYVGGCLCGATLLLAPGLLWAPVPPPDLFIGLGAFLTLAVMLTYPLGLRTGRERLCFWLDIATVMAGASGFGGYLVVNAAAGGRRFGVLEVVTGPVVFLLLVFAVAKLLMGGAAPYTRRTGLIGAGAAGLTAVVQASGPSLYLHGQYRWYFAGTAATSLLTVTLTRVQQRQVRGDPAVLDRRRRRPYSPVPYLAIAATYGLLVVTLKADGLHPRSWAVLGAAILSTVLVVARQLTAFADNARLLSQLNAKVDELDQARRLLQAAVDERDALTDQLRELAFRDSLTGLANRALFHDRVTHAASRARREGGEVVVMLVDLDDFKPVNDRHGHAAGDAVLAEIATRIRDCVRDGDTVARLGGDEFAVLLDHPDPGAVTAVADRIVAAARRPVELGGGTAVRVGASVGIAGVADGLLDPDLLLRAADAAMYDVKRRGKGAHRGAGAARAA